MKSIQRDPDPLLVDLLVNLAATGIAGILVKSGRFIWSSRARRTEPLFEPPTARDDLGAVRSLLDDIEAILARAETLVPAVTRRELGGVLLLDPEDLVQVEHLREHIFEKLRDIDAITQRIGVEAEAIKFQSRRRRRPPKEFQDLVTLADRRLRKSRSATLSGVAFADVRAAVVAMRAMLQLITEANLRGNA